jgi:hypothetical protein
MIGSLALANALKDFGEPAAPSAGAFDLGALDDMTFAMPPPSEPAVDVSAQVEAAVREAEEALVARLQAEHEEQVAELTRAHEEALAAMSAEMVEALRATISGRLGEMEARLVEMTTAVTARILGMALTDEVAGRAVESLAATISRALRDDETIRIRVTGPSSLYEALVEALPQHREQLHFEESARADLSVTIDESLFETQVSQWSKSVSEVLT